MITELFTKVAMDYHTCRKTQDFKQNPMAKMIREDIPNAFLKSGILDKHYIVKGSAGKGRWVKEPWIGIMDERVTKKPQEGVYIVFCFSQDGRTLYAALTQGETKSTNEKLVAEAKKIRKSIPTPNGYTADNDIGTTLRSGVIFYKAFSTDKMPNDKEIFTECKLLLQAYQLYYTRFIKKGAVPSSTKSKGRIPTVKTPKSPPPQPSEKAVNKETTSQNVVINNVYQEGDKFHVNVANVNENEEASTNINKHTVNIALIALIALLSVIFIIVIIAVILNSRNNSAANSQSEESTVSFGVVSSAFASVNDSMSSVSDSVSISISEDMQQTDFIPDDDKYIVPVYEDFNSYARDNGLLDTSDLTQLQFRI